MVQYKMYPLPLANQGNLDEVIQTDGEKSNNGDCNNKGANYFEAFSNIGFSRFLQALFDRIFSFFIGAGTAVYEWYNQSVSQLCSLVECNSALPLFIFFCKNSFSAFRLVIIILSCCFSCGGMSRERMAFCKYRIVI